LSFCVDEEEIVIFSLSWSTLRFACESGSCENAEILCSFGLFVRSFVRCCLVLQRCFLPYNTGAELECADYERGVTPLMRACALNKLDCVRLLLELNGDTAAVDCDGWTVFETAYEEIKQLLLVHKKKKVSFLSLSLSLCYSQGVLGATPNRVATTDIESNSLRTRYSIDAICSTGNHWYMSRLLVARSTAIRFALDHRLVAKLRSTVASEEDSLDRIRSRFDSEIETINFHEFVLAYLSQFEMTLSFSPSSLIF
jgi:hypothetical protein